jgi:hypothetical protein
VSVECRRAGQIKDVTPSALGCENFLKTGSRWVHLRLCRRSPCRLLRRLAQPSRNGAFFLATGHPVIEGYDPPEGWGWCYVDEVLIDLGDRKTPQRGPML